MAALIGYLKGNRGEVSRLGSNDSGMRSRLETWNGSVTVNIAADGSFTVYVGGKGETGRLVLLGNVDTGKVEFNG